MWAGKAHSLLSVILAAGMRIILTNTSKTTTGPIEVKFGKQVVLNSVFHNKE